MKFVIGDIHGCYNTLIALLKKLPPEANNTNIIFVGDLIDRGPDSRKVINFVRDGGYDVVFGNHEGLMIEAVYDYVNHNIEVEDNRNWMQNGGSTCLANYQESYGVDYKSLIEDAEWLESLPKVRIYKDEVDNQGRVLTVTHAVSIDFIDNYIHSLRELNELGKIEYLSLEEQHKFLDMDHLALWNRDVPKSGSKEYFNISGHNVIDYFIFDDRNELKVKKEKITQEHIVLDNDLGYACIDTGAFSKTDNYGDLNCSEELGKTYGNPYRGKLTCVSFPGLEVTQQCNEEEFDWR